MVIMFFLKKKHVQEIRRQRQSSLSAVFLHPNSAHTHLIPLIYLYCFVFSPVNCLSFYPF